MSDPSNSPSFAEWLKYIFDHSVTDPHWYFEPDAPQIDIASEQVVNYTTMLFTKAGETLFPFSDAQVNQGLWFLINEGCSPLYALADVSIAVELRVACILSIVSLFEQCFVPRCTPHLSHLARPDSRHGGSPINMVCYMWWDIFPLYGAPQDPLRLRIDQACLGVMANSLELPSIACQESALHGLSHWGVYYPDRCETLIKSFIEGDRELSADLLRYALLASQQGVL